MLRLTAALQDPLRLIGFGFWSGERLIAARSRKAQLSVGDQPTPETHRGADYPPEFRPARTQDGPWAANQAATGPELSL